MTYHRETKCPDCGTIKHCDNSVSCGAVHVLAIELCALCKAEREHACLDPFDVDCPSCHAEVGESCFTDDGSVMDAMVHGHRMVAAASQQVAA